MFKVVSVLLCNLHPKNTSHEHGFKSHSFYRISFELWIKSRKTFLLPLKLPLWIRNQTNALLHALQIQSQFVCPWTKFLPKFNHDIWSCPEFWIKNETYKISKKSMQLKTGRIVSHHKGIDRSAKLQSLWVFVNEAHSH